MQNRVGMPEYEARKQSRALAVLLLCFGLAVAVGVVLLIFAAAGA